MSLFILSLQIQLSLSLSVLFNLSLLEFNTFSEFSNRHFFQQPMTSSFSWVKSLCSLYWDLFQFSDLSDQLLFSSHLYFIFILLSLESLSDLLVDFISDLSVFLFQLFLGFTCFVLLAVYLLHDLHSLFVLLIQVLLSLFLSYVCLDFHILGVHLVLLRLHLLSNDGLLSCQLHFYFLSLNMIKPENFVSLVHFSLPSHKFSFISLINHQIL